MLSKEQTLGKYRILDRIGSGGFGTVYLALDTWVNQKVALKVPHQQEDEVLHMLKEPRIMADLSHPNIVRLITTDRINGIFFIVLEYIQGQSLDLMIRNNKLISPELTLKFAIQVVSGMEFAHSKKILHRDLRPANILICDDNTAKITDFGTSKVLELTPAMTRVGSPPYMAPEHFRGLATFQSDIWSLGVTFYEMLTGTVPFYDADPLKIARALESQRIVPPHLRTGTIPKGISEIVMKALQPNLGDRYLNMQQFLMALQSLHKMENSSVSQAITSPVSSKSTVGSKTNKICRFCYAPLSRMATLCPKCGEKN